MKFKGNLATLKATLFPSEVIKKTKKQLWVRGQIPDAEDGREERRKLPGPQLVLAPPGELAEALVALVVVVEDAVQGGSAQVHQRVVGRLLLLAAGVTVEEVVDLVSDFWKSGQNATDLQMHQHQSLTSV